MGRYDEDRSGDDHPIVREWVKAEPVMPLWLWASLAVVAIIIAMVAF